MSVAAVVVAAGSGQRLGLDVPKAFVLLAGRPLLAHALQALAHADIFDHVVVVAPEAYQNQAEALLAQTGLTGQACAGGRTRQESVARGVALVSEHVVAVHDAARALVSAELVQRVVAALDDDWDAVAPGIAVADTMKRVDLDDGRVLETVGRATLRAVQTPQVFRRELLSRLHAEAHGADATDDLALVEEAGGRVRLIEGEASNFKITTQADLAIAEALLANWVHSGTYVAQSAPSGSES